MNKKKILIWEMAGMAFIFLLGALFHFIYEMSGYLKPIAVIGAVNESTWEHIKIGFWPAFIFGIIEFFSFGRKIKAFLFAKSISYLVIAFLIPGLFYLYIFITGENNLAVDILIFLIAIIVAQLASYKIISGRRYHAWMQVIGIILLIIEVLAFSLLTYYPPRFELFRDPIYGKFGIMK